MGMGGFMGGLAAGYMGGEKMKLDWRKADRDDEDAESSADYRASVVDDGRRKVGIEENKAKQAQYEQSVKDWQESGEESVGIPKPAMPAPTELPSLASATAAREERAKKRKDKAFKGWGLQIKNFLSSRPTAEPITEGVE